MTASIGFCGDPNQTDWLIGWALSLDDLTDTGQRGRASGRARERERGRLLPCCCDMMPSRVRSGPILGGDGRERRLWRHRLAHLPLFKVHRDTHAPYATTNTSYLILGIASHGNGRRCKAATMQDGSGEALALAIPCTHGRTGPQMLLETSIASPTPTPLVDLRSATIAIVDVKKTRGRHAHARTPFPADIHLSVPRPRLNMATTRYGPRLTGPRLPALLPLLPLALSRTISQATPAASAAAS